MFWRINADYATVFVLFGVIDKSIEKKIFILNLQSIDKC